MKERLIAHLIVKSVNSKNVPVDFAQWALELRCKEMDLRLMLNHLQIQKELSQWEEEGQLYVNVFKNN